MNPREDKIRILMVDDEKSFLDMATKALMSRGCDVTTASNATEAMNRLESEFFDVAVLDVRMPGMDGISLLSKLANERPTLQIVMLSGHATVPVAVEAMKLGAFEFLLKPLEVEKFMQTIKRAADRAKSQRRNVVLSEELEKVEDRGPIVGESPAMQEVFSFIDKAATSSLPVIITGESGTGKELVARAIHAKSSRSSRPLVVVDGSSLRDELIASELFGHEKGAFTGAVRKKVGLFEVADRGSIFLDEIGELSAPNQAALLRVIEYGTFRPVGSVREVHTDVRIIAATNKDVEKSVEREEFRKDLYYRLRGMALYLPPLRERKGDIGLLSSHFLTRNNAKTGRSITLSPEVVEILEAYSWSGNVRELHYFIELASLLAEEEGSIRPHHLPEEIIKGKGREEKYRSDHPGGSVTFTEEITLDDFRNHHERIYVSWLLEKYNRNKSQVAKVLGVSSSVFYRMLRRLDLF